MYKSQNVDTKICFIFRSSFPVLNQSLRGKDKYFTHLFVKSNTHLRVCSSKHDRGCQHCILYVNCKYILSHTILFYYHQNLEVKICDKEILSYIIPHTAVNSQTNKQTNLVYTTFVRQAPYTRIVSAGPHVPFTKPLNR